MSAPFILVALVIAGVIFLAIRAANAGAKRERAEIESGSRPEYIYEGRAYHSLDYATRTAGDDYHGWKISMSFFKDRPAIRVSIQFKKPRSLNVFDLDPIDIEGVTALKTPWVLVIEHHSDGIDLPLIVYPGEWDLEKRLVAAKREADRKADESATAMQRNDVRTRQEAEPRVDFAIDAASDTRQKGEEPDPEFDAILEEIRVACETDPEQGLAMIDHYVGVVGEQRFLRFSRVLACRRILVGSEADAGSGRFGHTLDEVAHRLSSHKLECGMKALHNIAAIEREEPDYFSDGDAKELILDAVCHLMERARPSIVQQTLGWTKLDYFGAGRVSSINEKAPGGKEVQRVPEEVKDRVFAVRFKADTIVRSALAMRASGPGSGRGIGFMLFERLPDPNERVIGDRIHVGSVDIGENGDWWYTPKGDGPSIRGGPWCEERAERD